jgi:hypothetical protein
MRLKLFVDGKIVGEVSADKRTQDELFTDKSMRTNIIHTIHHHPRSAFQPLQTSDFNPLYYERDEKTRRG